jgi:hypothetical protein
MAYAVLIAAGLLVRVQMLWRCAGGLKAAAGIGILFQSIAVFANIPDSILGGADSFAVLGTSGISNNGWSRLYRHLGVKSGAAVIGFPPGAVFGGSNYAGGPVVREARLDAAAAYNRLVGLPSFPVAS